MAAAMNGLALGGPFIPYGGTFLVFNDYLRPALRLSALMGLRVVYVMTHDSIGLGEDGPTHQPVEHLASLRAMPNVLVMRPADAVETAECWAAALNQTGRPSVLALSRQNLPTLRTAHTAENLCAKGGYVIAEAAGPRAATLIATGSEVALAVEAAKALNAEGIATAVVSLPCWELFDAQPADYRAAVLGGSGGARRHRGGRRHGLGTLRRRRSDHRDAGIRRLRARRETLRTLRLHRGQRGADGEDSLGLNHKPPGPAGCGGGVTGNDRTGTGGLDTMAMISMPAAAGSRGRIRLRRARVQRQQHGTGAGDHGGGEEGRRPGDPAGEPRRAAICGRRDDQAHDHGRGRDVSRYPGVHAPGPRQTTSRLVCPRCPPGSPR